MEQPQRQRWQPWKRPSKSAVMVLLMLLAITLIGGAGRWWWPHWQQQLRQQAVAYVEQQYGVTLTLTALNIGWHNQSPQLQLQGLSLPAQPTLPLQLTIEELTLQLDLWRSLRQGAWLFAGLALDNVTVTAPWPSADNRSGQWRQWQQWRQRLLTQFQRLDLSQVTLILQHPQRPPLQVHLVHWHAHQQGPQYHMDAAFTLDAATTHAPRIHLALVLDSPSDANFAGRAVVRAEQVPLQPWLSQQWPALVPQQGQLNLRAGIVFDERGIEQIRADFAGSQWGWSTSEPLLAIEQADFIWSRTAQGWRFGSSEVQAVSGGEPWRWAGVHAWQQGTQQSWQLAPLPFAPSLPLMAAAATAWWPALAQRQPWLPSGVVGQGEIGPLWLAYQDEQWQGALTLTDIGWQSTHPLSRAEGIQGQLRLTPQALQLALTGQQLDLDWPAELAAPITLDNWQAQGAWLHQQQRLQLDSLAWQNPDLSGQLQAQLQLGAVPELQLHCQYQLADLRRLPHYLPKRLSASVRNYLSQALQHGQVSHGQCAWQGPLPNLSMAAAPSATPLTTVMPSPMQTGTAAPQWQVQMALADLQFQFLKDWPPITQGQAQLTFAGQSFKAVLQQGQLAGIDVAGTQLSIAELGPRSELEIHTELMATAAQAQAVVANTPLASTIGATLTQVIPQQTVPLSLAMRFYLGREVSGQRPEIRGVIELQQQQVWLAPLQQSLTQLSGQLHFHNDQVWAKQLNGSWLAQPIELAMRGAKNEAGYGVEIQMASQWQWQRLPPAWQSPLLSHLAGESVLDGHIALQFSPQQLHYQVQIQSDLAGTAITLPAPLTLAREATEPLVLTLSGGKQHDKPYGELQLNLGEHLRWQAALQFEPQRPLFEDYLLAIGTLDEPVAIGRGGQLHWYSERAVLSDWLPLIPSLTAASAATEPSPMAARRRLLAPLAKVRLQSGQIELFGVALGSGVLQGEPNRDGWQLQLVTDYTDAQFNLGQGAAQFGIAMHADFLHLPSLSVPAAPVAEAGAPIDAARTFAWLQAMPALDITIDDLKIGSMAIGPAQLLAHRQGTHYQLQHLQLGHPTEQLQAKGRWYAIESGTHTVLEGRVTAESSERLMSRLGINHAIKNGSGHADFLLHWAGAPWQSRLANLNGQLSFAIKNGHLVEISDKGTRLLSLFSLESLMRKLALDFSDVFASGMHFNQFRGDLVLDGGIAYTDNARLNGNSGSLRLNGWTDLATQTLDYQISFAPALTSSLPAVMYLSTGTLGVGLGALAVTKLLEPVIEVITQLRYRLTGSVARPQLQELERLQPPSALPAKADEAKTHEHEH
ncbi:MAG: YhdP family protein [Ferrimonas sp.]